MFLRSEVTLTVPALRPRGSGCSAGAPGPGPGLSASPARQPRLRMSQNQNSSCCARSLSRRWSRLADSQLSQEIGSTLHQASMVSWRARSSTALARSPRHWPVVAL